MKNLFTYKNSIASSLKRYSKFLLLAVMFLAFNTQAWAAAPSEIYIKCNTTTGADNYADGAFYWVELTKVDGQNKWVSPKITLNNNNNTFYLATSQSDNAIFQKGITLGMKDFSPTCATNFDTDKDWGGKAKIYLGKAIENPSCEVAFVITYKSDTEYTIQLDSPCIEAEPAVTTGTGTRNADNQLVISNNILNELYKDTHCDRKLDRLGVQMLGTDKTSDKGYYLFNKGASEEWLDYRGAAYTVTYPGTEEVCYRAFANYQNHYAYGEIKCTTPTPDPEPDPSGNKPVIRIGKQPVVSNLTDVAMNFQMADWGCNIVEKVKVYYTVTDAKTTNSEAPTIESSYWEFDTEIGGNINFDLSKSGLPSGNYNIRAVACDSKGCGELSDMASFTIQACEKPAVPTINNANRQGCSNLNIAYGITDGNKVLITINEGTETTTVAPQDGQEYTAAVAPTAITIQPVNYNGASAQSTINGLDGNTQYTVTCYQYVPETYCYSEPTTYVIEKIAPVVEVEMTEITTKTATATIRLTPFTGTAINVLRVTLYNGDTKVQGPFDIQQTLQDNVATYFINHLNPNTTYTLQVEAGDNKGCQTTEVVEFTTGVCYTPEVKTVSGVNTTGKVEATITLAASANNCIYQLFIEDTPIDGSAQEGTGNDLQWIVTQKANYVVKAWFNTKVQEVPDYCVNAPVKMGEYNFACVQAPTPVISIDKNTICSNDANGATIVVKTVDGITYKLYKDGVEQDNKMVNNAFAGITEAGTYSVVAVGNAEDYCKTSSTSQAVTLTVIDANASVTVSPSTATTNPWVPVAFTVNTTNASPYTLVYKAGGVDVTEQMVVTQTGNSYQLKIPRPENWAKGNASAGNAIYTVEATLQIAGDVNCGSSATLTITLEDTFDNCD